MRSLAEEGHREVPARADVVVVGGGPAGAIVAATAAPKAYTVVLERAPKRPARCAGLVGLQGREFLSVPDELVLAEIRRFRLHGPSGGLLELSSPSPKAFVVDRARLDILLLERARQSGAHVRVGVEAKGWQPGKLLTTCGEIDVSVVVGADGARSGVAWWAGLPGPERTLVGVQAMVVADGMGDCVDVFVGGVVPPGSFGWAVPAGVGRINVGVVTGRGREAGATLDRMLSTHFRSADVAGRIGGLIPVGPPEVTVGDGVVLVGDAAGQVKPLSGGGLYYGALCAHLAGRAAAQGPCSLQGYETGWREDLGEEIAVGLAARRFVEGLSEEEMGRVIELLGGHRIADFLATEGDIDRPAGLLRKLLCRPSLWGEVASLLSAVGGWGRVHELVGGLRFPPDKA